MNATSSPRLYYLDNLRSFVILIVVVFHAAMGFMLFAPEWWPVIDPQRNLFFTGLILLTDVPIMPIMFLIAGYFGIASLAAHGQRRFWQGKLLRIVIPWVLGFLTVASLSPYMWLVARHKNPPFAYFYTHMFFTKTFTTQGALWFLGALTVFYLLLSLVYLACKPLGEQRPEASSPTWKFFALFLFIPCAVYTFINQFWFDFQWVPVKYILWVQPTRISLEAFYFALGVYAWRRRWFTAEGYHPSSPAWIPVAFLSGIFLLVYKFQVGFLMKTIPIRAGHAFLHCLFCLTTTFALLYLWSRYLNRTSAFLRSLASGSYAIYWIHMPFVMLSALAIRGFHWNIYLKYLAVCALALTGSYLAATYLLSWLPFFGEWKTPAKATSASESPVSASAS
jgi:peptidoglycan/LPS O-acetylase OafA/YrhL